MGSILINYYPTLRYLMILIRNSAPKLNWYNFVAILVQYSAMAEAIKYQNILNTNTAYSYAT